MKKHEAIERIKEHMRIHGIGQPPHVYIAEALNLAIDALENSDPAWKPCSAQLPKSGLIEESGHNKEYLVTVKRDSGYAYRTIATRIEGCWHTETGFDFEDDETIIAWQPIPDPYNPTKKVDHIVDANKKVDQTVATGSTSDGYHTFDELYRHRGILFALICADHKDIAWKSLKHSDGTMYPGMFLCGIDTPYGQATYHMDLNPFWNLIQVKELHAAPEWDGHTPDMALNRIAAMAADRFVPLENGVVED